MRSRFSTIGIRFLVVLMLLPLCACSRTEELAGEMKSIARIEAIEGEAFVVRGTDRRAATSGASLGAGDRLETGSPGRMRVRLEDDSVLAIGASTKIELKELLLEGATRSGRLDLAAGRFWMNVTAWTGSGSSRYEIYTPNAVAGVRGTTLWGDTDVDAICALEGAIEVRSLRNPQIEAAKLTSGSCASRLSEGELAPLTPSSEQIQEFLGEVLIRTK